MGRSRRAKRSGRDKTHSDKGRDKTLSDKGKGRPRSKHTKRSKGSRSDDGVVVIAGCRYQKSKKLGTGGSGSVFEIIKEDGGTKYALKEASLRMHGDIFQGEVERLQALKNCPHIVDLIAHDFISNGMILRMVLELGETDLETEIRRHEGKFGPSTSRSYSVEIAKGIQEMHSHSIIHLDIKLANVLFFRGALKLVDLGLSATIKSDELTKKVDIWGFGVVVYQMVYGRKPFTNTGKSPMMAILDPNVRLQHDIGADPALTEFLEVGYFTYLFFI
ncbi:unnamed protein product [Nippostrongylus brasiliensis]|uniref:Dual specificity protein kinase TTK (inferred by orthology to a human protein) n=1 Tax=Nippostrongylus brasiliensis TaxID=27835 RepID=A0A0N4XDA9_NIPBR|nr:unnamed protein product [Nippostrongylus brasiliensis]